MRTIILSGELGKKFGREHQYEVRSPAEAVRALCANFPEFQKELMESHKKNVGYKVFNGKTQLSNAEETKEPASGVIRIAPVIMGANATTRIILGTALIVAGIAAGAVPGLQGASPFLINAGAALVLGGVIEMLSPIPKVKEPSERPENKPSYLFNGPVNTTAQGHPVPVGYGRLRVGGGLVSAGISIEQIMAGFKRVRVDKTVIRTAFGTQDNFSPALPANWYRKELVAYRTAAETELDEEWDFRIYYYDLVLQEIVV